MRDDVCVQACVHVRARLCVCVCVCVLLKVISELVVCIVFLVVIETPRFINEFESMPEEVLICFQICLVIRNRSVWPTLFSLLLKELIFVFY